MRHRTPPVSPDIVSSVYPDIVLIPVVPPHTAVQAGARAAAWWPVCRPAGAPARTPPPGCPPRWSWSGCSTAPARPPSGSRQDRRPREARAGTRCRGCTSCGRPWGDRWSGGEPIRELQLSVNQSVLMISILFQSYCLLSHFWTGHSSHSFF